MDKIEEIWRDIKGFEGLYQISNLGRLKSVQRIILRGNGRPITINERIRKSKVQDVGYLKTSLCKDGIHSSHRIHRLIAEAFIENPAQKRTINHKDGDKLNNSIDNLEWATHSENNQHAWDNNLNYKKPR